MSLKDLFYMHKSDRKVLLVLLSVAAVVLCALYFTGEAGTTEATEATEATEPQKPHQAQWSQRTQKTQWSQETQRYQRSQEPQWSKQSQHPQPSRELFFFDPNTADSTDLLRLGLKSWQVHNLIKYRSKGGIFRKKKDFAKLYGLTVKDYRELEPYIRISSDYLPASTLIKEETRDTLLYPTKLKEGETIDLNTSDTTLLKRVPGIGSYFARRITDYRQRLGGFTDLSQLDEIDNFPVSAKAFLTLGSFTPRRLAVNKLSKDELRKHPYITYRQAKVIEDYRRVHGPLSSLDDLRLLPEFPPEAIERLRPYVSYER